MTKKRSSKPINSFEDKNEQYEEFILADLDLMRKDWELAPVSLDDVMDDHHIVTGEEFIIPVDYDPLSTDSNFFDEASIIPEVKIIEESTKTDKENHDKTKYTEAFNVFDHPIDERLRDIETETSSDSYMDIEIPTITPSMMPPKKPLTEELLNKKSTKRGQEDNTTIQALKLYENKLKKSLRISYFALSFSMLALVAIVILSTMVYNTQANNTKLIELTTQLQENISDLKAKYESLEFSRKNVDMDSINQQKIDNTIQPVTIPPEYKIIDQYVKSNPLKKVIIKPSPLKQPSIVYDGTKKNKKTFTQLTKVSPYTSQTEHINRTNYYKNR
ncbi:MAG: hypothetical protein WCP66_02165 [Methylococcales bacterium]